MKKQLKNYVLIWAIVVAVYNLVVFVIPRDVIEGYDKFGGAFWVSYAFIMAAFLTNLALSIAFFRQDDLEKVFLNMPVLRLAYSAVIVTFIAGTLCMIIPNLENWVAIIACAIILAAYAIAVVTAHSAAEAVEDAGAKVKAQTAAMKMLTADAQALLTKSDDPAIKAECKKVYEALRFSDPVSNEALSAVETRISAKLLDFADAVKAGKADEAKALSNALQELIDDRAIKCKALK